MVLKKVGLRIKELERLYGIKEGNNQYSLPNNSVSSQSDIAAQLGISVDTLQNYKMLADMIPELEDLADTSSRKNHIQIMNNMNIKQKIRGVSTEVLKVSPTYRGIFTKVLT